MEVHPICYIGHIRQYFDKSQSKAIPFPLCFTCNTKYNTPLIVGITSIARDTHVHAINTIL